MGVFHPTRVTCTCGHAFVVNLARSVNAVRMPALRNLILSGAFHRVSCPSCGRRVAVESPLYYTDLRRGAVFHVRPRNERYQYEQDSARLQRVAASLPGELGENGHRQLRVIYGLDELREKLVAQDAGLDDRMVELVKVMLLQEHPFLMNKPRLLVHLQKVSRQSFDFIVYHHHESQGHYVSLPRPAVQEALASPATAREWMKRAGLRANLFELPDHWVNFRRWTTRYSSLDALRRFASDRETGRKVDLGSREFRRMVERLPRGSQLPGWAKRDLGALFEYARDHRLGPAQEALFEVRFGIELEDEWARNRNLSDIDTIWQLLRSLPPSNVEGNSRIDKIDLDKGEGGGWYGDDVIGIGGQELGERESFEDVLRHEVGHGVHEQKAALVTPWLERRFGWRFFNPSADGIDAWVGLMGGWGRLPVKERASVRQWLRQALGEGESWGPGKAPRPPAGHAWWRDGFGPRLAYENTGSDWYQNYPRWYRKDGRAFFLNYWYVQFMAVDVKTLSLVARMPDAYAAMSHMEFFAELYALYYEIDNPKRRALPRDVTAWLDRHIGIPHAAPSQAKAAAPAGRPRPKAKRRRSRAAPRG